MGLKSYLTLLLTNFETCHMCGNNKEVFHETNWKVLMSRHLSWFEWVEERRLIEKLPQDPLSDLKNWEFVKSINPLKTSIRLWTLRQVSFDFHLSFGFNRFIDTGEGNNISSASKRLAWRNLFRHLETYSNVLSLDFNSYECVTVNPLVFLFSYSWSEVKWFWLVVIW